MYGHESTNCSYITSWEKIAHSIMETVFVRILEGHREAAYRSVKSLFDEQKDIVSFQHQQ